MSKSRLPATIAGALLVLGAAWARAGEVQVAVAADFAMPLAQIAEGYTAATGHTLKISAGATGRLYAQIVAGAPFEVLLAADEQTPRRLVEEGLAVAGSNFTYAIGKLALWSARPAYVDDQGAVLGSGSFAHLALADPKLAPYGAAGLEVMKARGLADALAPRIVSAESTAQVRGLVADGAAELGFVALSQLLVPGQPLVGSYWRVPPSLHHELRQDAVLLKKGEKNPAALALLQWLKSEPTKTVIQIYGYGHAQPRP